MTVIYYILTMKLKRIIIIDSTKLAEQVF